MPTRRTSFLAAILAGGALVTAGCTSSSGGAAPTSSAPMTPSPTVQTSTPTAPSSTSTTTTSSVITIKKAGGDTSLKFASAFVKALFTHGVNTTPTGKAGLDDTHLALLPITGGSATVYTSATARSKSSADLQHKGSGLIVSNPHVRVAVSSIVLSLGARPAVSVDLTVTAKGRTGAPKAVRLFDLSLASGKASRAEGGGATLSGLRATLDPAAAKALDTAFGTKIFSGYGSKQVGTVSVTVTG